MSSLFGSSQTAPVVDAPQIPVETQSTSAPVAQTVAPQIPAEPKAVVEDVPETEPETEPVSVPVSQLTSQLAAGDRFDTMLAQNTMQTTTQSAQVPNATQAAPVPQAPEVKRSFTGVALRSDGTVKTYGSMDEMVKDLSGFDISPLCKCSACSEELRTFGTQPVEQTSTQHSTVPEQQTDVTEDKSTDVPQPSTQQSTQPSTQQSTQPFTQQSTSLVESLLTMLDKKTAEYIEKIKKDPYYSSYRYNDKIMRYVPLMRPKVRLVREDGEIGITGSFIALSKSIRRSIADLDESDAHAFFDTELIYILMCSKSTAKTLRARVRLLSDMRTTQKRGSAESPTVFAPVLVELLKVYIATYPEQDAIRFHPDGFGYDVYADMGDIARIGSGDITRADT